VVGSRKLRVRFGARRVKPDELSNGELGVFARARAEAPAQLTTLDHPHFCDHLQSEWHAGHVKNGVAPLHKIGSPPITASRSRSNVGVEKPTRPCASSE
jgi:hypothetical protein